MDIKKIKCLTGDVFECKARGVNMRHPVEIRALKCQIKIDSTGFATFSMRDEKDNIILQIEVTDDFKELVRKLTEEENNVKE